MDIRALLHQLREAEDAVRTLRMEKEHMADTLYGGAGPGAGMRVQGGTPASPVERAVMAMEAVSARLAAARERYASLAAQAGAIVAGMEKPRHQQVLRLRYLCGLTWEEVAEAMGYQEVSSAHRCHREALAAAEKRKKAPPPLHATPTL